MDQTIEEYKTLRAEILRNFEAMERNLIACITANGVALAYGIKESQPGVVIIASLIPVYFWIQQTHHRQAVAKIASYISIFFEGKETNLMWESRIQKMGIGEPGFLSGIAYFMRKVFHPYPVLFITSIVVLVWKWKRTTWSPWLVLCGLLVFALVVLFVAIRSDVPYTRLRNHWTAQFKKLKLEE